MSIVDPVLSFLPWLVFGQGLLLSLAVLSRWSHRGNRYLGSLLMLLSLHSVVFLAWMRPNGAIIPEITIVSSGLPFIYGPLIYRYVWHSLYREWRAGRPFILHALPGIANLLIYGAIFLVIGREAFTEITLQVFNGQGPIYVQAIEFLKIIQGLCYAAAVIILLRKNGTALAKWTAKEQQKQWLIWLAATFAFNWLLVFVSAVILGSSTAGETWRSTLPVLQMISFLAFFYMITFFSLRYPAVLDPQEVREAIRRKLNLSEQFIGETLRRLKRAEESRFYTDPELTLTSLAEELGLHPNALSYIINEEKGMGFREYLNSLRLEYFLYLAAEGGTLLESAFAAGFASKTTFLRAFRTRYGTTPAEYLAE